MIRVALVFLMAASTEIKNLDHLISQMEIYTMRFLKVQISFPPDVYSLRL